MSHLYTINQIQKKLPAVRSWLSRNGAEVLEPTNEWEVLRFRAGGQTSVVYRQKTGGLTYTGVAADALRSYANGQNWRAAPATPRVKVNVSPVVTAILKRDGGDCFACGWPLHDDISIDHLVPLTAGGPNHTHNMVLMHETCNHQCGPMSAPEKVRMHVAARMAR